MKKTLRYFSVAPAVFMLLLIFGFSAQDGPSSGSLSYRVCCNLLSIADRVFSLELSVPAFASKAESMQFFVRKAAHITEYLLLTFSFFLPLRTFLSQKEDKETTKIFFLRYVLPSFLLSVVCAAADEFHQSFVPGRCGTPVDVCIDSVGVVIALAILTFFHCRLRKKRSTLTQDVLLK